MQTDQQERRARARQRRVRDFFYHLVVYAFVLAILFLVSGVSGALVWLLVIWGFALAMHGVYAYFG